MVRTSTTVSLEDSGPSKGVHMSSAVTDCITDYKDVLEIWLSVRQGHVRVSVTFIICDWTILHSYFSLTPETSHIRRALGVQSLSRVHVVPVFECPIHLSLQTFRKTVELHIISSST